MVLLILSGVTISTLLGDNGIIEQAKKNAELSKRSTVISSVQLDILEAEMEGEITQEKLEEILNKYGIIEKNDLENPDNVTGLKVEGVTDSILIEELYPEGLTGGSGDTPEEPDTTPPEVTISLSATSAETGTTITATVTHTDDKSEVDIKKCKYLYNTTSGNLGTTNTKWDTASTFNTNPQSIDLLATTEGTYYLHVLTVDTAGNKAEKVSEAIAVKQLVTGITLNKTTATMTVGDTLKLTATVSPDNADNKTVNWSTSSSSIATVSSTGLVTAKTAGSVTITATAADESGKSAKCKITVQTAGISADDIVKAIVKSDYYGKTVTGYTCTNSSACNWKIFYVGSDFSADGKNHIYLIADDYIARTAIPKSSGGNVLNDGSSSYPKAAYFTNILGDYTGSASVTNANIKKLNNDYFNTKKYTSTSNNMKAVAYMCDTSAWSVYKGAKADYAIGGPTIEMLFKSYGQLHYEDNEAQASNAIGYMIKRDRVGADWIINSTGVLTTYDSLYVISSTTNARRYWLASPSAAGADDVMVVSNDGYVGNCEYSNSGSGFRPLVCLSSDVKLEEQTNGTFKIK